jgi:hypothetical protein
MRWSRPGARQLEPKPRISGSSRQERAAAWSLTDALQMELRRPGTLVVHLATGDPPVPPGEYVYLSCHSRLSNDGLAVEDATMWAPDGRVLAVA